jgi:hypothetical protein
MKLNSSVTKFLTNKWVLNIVALLALFNVIGYAVTGNNDAVLYFIIIAVLATFFSKNMIIVLGIPLIIVNLLSLKMIRIEGMENNTSNTTESSKTETNDKISQDQTKINELVKKNSDTKSSQGLQMHNIDTEVHDKADNAAQSTGGSQEGKSGFEVGRRKNRGYEIDYATTIEDAYDELNNILGSDGIQRLTSDTQNLMKQQMQLAEAMKDMGPVIKSIAPMVENLKGMVGDMGDGKNGLGSILDLAKKFSSQAAPV